MTVKGQVLTNNKDAGIPKRKDISIPQEIDVDIPISKILLQSPIKHIVLSRNQPLKKKLLLLQKKRFDTKKENSIIGWANSIIAKITKIIIYQYPVQLKVTIVEYFQTYLITMVTI